MKNDKQRAILKIIIHQAYCCDKSRENNFFGVLGWKVVSTERKLYDFSEEAFHHC